MNPGKGLWRTTILRWLSAYALVVLFVVILVGLISIVTLNAVEHSARIEQQTKMQNLRTNMDALLVSIDDTLTMVGADERLHILLASTPPYTAYELYLLYDLNRSFPKQIAMPGPWNSIYLYVKQGEFVLFNNGKFNLPSAYKQLDYELSIEAWRERLDSQKEKVVLSFPAVPESGRTYLEYWFPVGSGQENSGVLVARLNVLEFQNRLDAMRSHSEEILVLLDERGRILLSTQPVDELLAQALPNKVSLAENFVEENGLLIGTARSRLSGWSYVSILPRDFLFSRSVFTRQVAWVLCAVILIVGLILSIVAVFRSYRPMKRLYDLAKQNAPEGESTDAYRFLETSMRDLVHKSQEAQHTLQQYHSLLRQDLLLRLLNGAKVESTLLKSADMQFRWNSFVVYLASCENAEDLFFGEYSDDAHSLSLVAINDVLQKVYSQEADVYTLEQDDWIIGVMSLPESFDEERLLKLTQEAQQVLKSQLGLSIIVVLSDLKFGLEHIATCYEHAKEAWECEVLNGSSRETLVRYQPDRGDGAYIMDPDAPMLFARAIKKGDFAQAKVLMNRTIDNYLSSAHPMPDIARAILFTLVNALLEALQSADLPYDEPFLKSLRPAQRVLNCASIREQRLELERILDETDAYTLQLRTDPSQYIDGIKTFVLEKYGDTNMNVSGIALEMGMSVSSLSKLFKKKTDMGLLNYINQTRIEQACHYLTTTDLTLSEIAEKTGFLNSSTLIRNFKRTMGVTPGKYKQQKGRV